MTFLNLSRIAGILLMGSAVCAIAAAPSFRPDFLGNFKEGVEQEVTAA
jgi:hypothetical protein